MQPLRRASRSIAHLALFVAVAIFASGCKGSDDDGTSVLGTWLSEDGTGLMLRVFANDTMAWYLAAGSGSCVFVAEGTIDPVERTFHSEFGDEFPFHIRGDRLEVMDETGPLGGFFDRVQLASICYVNVPPIEVVSDRVIPLELGPEVPVTNGFGRAVPIEVPADTVSFGVYLFGNSVGNRVVFGGLIDPSGVNVIDEFGAPSPELAKADIQFCLAGHCSVVVPKEFYIRPTEGIWTAIVISSRESELEEVDVRAVFRSGPFGGGVFRVRPFVTTNLVAPDALDAALLEVAALFEESFGVTLDIEPIEAIDDPDTQVLFQDFLHPSTVSVMNQGDPDAINLFFAERLLGMPGVLGFASGIPASHGVVGPFNGLLVHLDNHVNAGGELLSLLLEETIAHEIGHLLGLFHTTESDASYHDPIEDTPECYLVDPDPGSSLNDHDLDMDGILFADECWDAGGDNLMFWTPSTSTGALVVQRELSPHQIYVIERSLAAP